MRSVRTRLWACHPQLEREGYRVALIDNVHSDIARLRGFYGSLGLSGEEEELVLREARSGRKS